MRADDALRALRVSASRTGAAARVRRAMGALALVAGVGLVASACKPAVFISVTNRSLSEVRSSGGLSEAAVCSAAGDDLSPLLRFQLVDTGGALIIEGEDELTDFDFRLNDTFTIQDLRVEPPSTTGASRLFPAPDIECEGAAENAACPVVAYAQLGFTCQPRTSVPRDTDTTLVCALGGVQVNVNSNETIQFVDDQRDAAVAILSASGNSIFGVDADGGIDPTWSSDPTNQRTSAYLRLLTSLEDAYPPSSGDVSPTDLCVASYREANTVNFLRTDDTSVDQCFLPVSDTSELRSFINRGLGVTEPDRGTNNYYDAMRELLEIYPGLGIDKTLHVVLFTDGGLAEEDVDYNQAFPPSSFDAVRQQFLNQGAVLHVAQLDNRPPNGTGVPVGPLGDLQQLACETGGTHVYVQDPELLEGYFSALAPTVPTHYRVPVSVNQLANLPIGSYKLETGLDVTVGGVSASAQYVADATVEQQQTDLRISLSNRGVCEAPADPSAPLSGNNCQPGRVCDAGACVPAFETLYGAPAGGGEGSGSVDG